MRLTDIPKVDIKIRGKHRKFDIDDPKLPDWIKDAAFTSGGFPYEKKYKNKEYERELVELQAELVKLQYWLKDAKQRVICLFEGRDAAGKGGSIGAIAANMNPRVVHHVALASPSDREQGEWYLQRYVSRFPTYGEMILFDRSWYNRAGVEPVMGFCTKKEHEEFLAAVPIYEAMLVSSKTLFFKFWLDVGQEMQLKRFHERRHDPCKTWKLSPMDVEAIKRWDDYTKARDLMFEKTHTTVAPWCVALSNDKKRARLNIIRYLLRAIEYEDRNLKVIPEVDPKILGIGPKLLSK